MESGETLPHFGKFGLQNGDSEYHGKETALCQLEGMALILLSANDTGCRARQLKKIEQKIK